MNAYANQRLLSRTSEDPDEPRGYLTLLFIAGQLQRVGDHATNIGE